MKRYPWFRTWNLSKQLLTGFGLALTTVGLVVVGASHRFMQVSLEKQVQVHAQAITQSLEFATEGPIEVGYTQMVQRVVENYATLPAVMEVAIVNPDYWTIAHNQQALQNQSYDKIHPELTVAVQQAIRSGEEISLEAVIDGKSAIVQILPFSSALFKSTGRRGLVIAIIDLQQVQQQVEQVFITATLTIASGTLLILVLMGIVIQQVVLKPLHRLNQAVVRSQATGQFQLPSTLPTNEIRFLTHNFNRVFVQRQRVEMALRASESRERIKSQELATTLHQLETLTAELQQAKLELEDRVRARTAELSGALRHLQTVQTQLLEREEKLRYDAFHDRLTGLPNRDHFMVHLEQVIDVVNHDANYLYAVLFIDLDHFKVVNDSLGHLIGDELLKQIPARLMRSLRTIDTVARLGGDEFVILLRNIKDAEQANVIANRLQEELKQPFQLGHHEMFTGASIGITLSTVGYHRPEEVLRDADIAMYHAKRNGKGRAAIFDAMMQKQAMRRLNLESDLRRAIAKQEFCLYYQPILLLSEQQLVGFEALVRWQHPVEGFISPDEFIPVAEETGLIYDLGRWVLRQACVQLRAWQQQFAIAQSMTMNVNLSAVQFRQPDLNQQVEAALIETGLTAQCLKLEITESTILEPTIETAQMMQRFRDIGVRLCVDDFGVGQSSLSRLQEFPIDTLKIDRSFVSRINSQTAEAATIKMIVALAQTSAMEVVAEGIETAYQMAVLQQLGCELGQGYLFSPPVNGDRATQLLMQAAQTTSALASVLDQRE